MIHVQGRHTNHSSSCRQSEFFTSNLAWGSWMKCVFVRLRGKLIYMAGGPWGLLRQAVLLLPSGHSVQDRDNVLWWRGCGIPGLCLYGHRKLWACLWTFPKLVWLLTPWLVCDQWEYHGCPSSPVLGSHLKATPVLMKSTWLQRTPTGP